jgi:hypothetical protein
LAPARSREAISDVDHPREVVSVLEQEFFDIGAGIAPFNCIPAP